MSQLGSLSGVGTIARYFVTGRDEIPVSLPLERGSICEVDGEEGEKSGGGIGGGKQLRSL